MVITRKISKVKKTSLLISMTVLFLIAVSYPVVAKASESSSQREKVMSKENLSEGESTLRYDSSNAGKEYSSIGQLMDRYIKAIKTSNSSDLKNIFLPNASYYIFINGKLSGGSIDLLYESVDKYSNPSPILYSIASVQITGRVASLSLDIADLGGVHIYDIFTLVKDDSGNWKIASKVAWRPDR